MLDGVDHTLPAGLPPLVTPIPEGTREHPCAASTHSLLPSSVTHHTVTPITAAHIASSRKISQSF